MKEIEEETKKRNTPTRVSKGRRPAREMLLFIPQPQHKHKPARHNGQTRPKIGTVICKVFEKGFIEGAYRSAEFAFNRFRLRQREAQGLRMCPQQKNYTAGAPELSIRASAGIPPTPPVNKENSPARCSKNPGHPSSALQQNQYCRVNPPPEPWIRQSLFSFSTRTNPCAFRCAVAHTAHPLRVRGEQ
jgi:hypothetical protein